MSVYDHLNEIDARHGFWYDPLFYEGPVPTWPDRDDDESIADYIVRCDVPAMVSTLRAVLEEHRAITVTDGSVICAVCAELTGTYSGGPSTYPCPTVRAIAHALEVE